LEFVMTLQEELERIGFPEHCDFWASSATSCFRCSGGTGSYERGALLVSHNINRFSHMSFQTCVWRFAR
jgi:hypothetical protein